MRRTVLHLVLAVVAVSSGAGAASFTWTGAGATRSWTDPANWAGGSAPPDDGTAAIAISAPGTIALDGTRVISTLSVPAAGTVTLQPGSQPGSALVVRGGVLSRTARGSLVSQVPLFHAGSLSLNGFENQTALGTGSVFNLGNTGTPGPLGVSQAIFVASGDAVPAASQLSLGAGAWLDLAGRALAIGSLAGSGSVTNTSGTKATLLVGLDGTDSMFSGVLGGQLADQTNGNGFDFVKVGGGTLTFSGASAIGGYSRVADGALVVTGTLTSGNPGFDYVVVGNSSAQHGTLWGTGNVGIIWTATNSVPGGVVNPGLPASRGILHADSADLRHGTLSVRVAGYGTAGVDYDQLDASAGSLTFDAESELDIDLGGLTATGGPITLARYSKDNGPAPLVRVLNNPGNLVAQISYGGSALTLTMRPSSPTAIPLFVVTPAHGLVTGESGRSATFTVALGKAPTANVTVPVASSDSNEGTVSSPSLSFTPANYSTPQTVTVTGVDDAVADGNVGYTIAVGPAVSSDAAFSGKSAPPVSVVNLDDDLITAAPLAGLVSTPPGQPAASFVLTFHAAPSQEMWMPLGTSAPQLGAPGPAIVHLLSTGSTPPPVTIGVVGMHSLQVGCAPYAIRAMAIISLDNLFNGFELPDVPICNQGDRAPSAGADALAVDEGSILQLAAPGVLANDSDPDGDPLAASLVSGPSHGALSLSSDGSLSYTPALGFNGVDSFVYQASDGALPSPATVQISVRNLPPVAVADAYSHSGTGSFDVGAPGVLANDSDPGHDVLSAQLSQAPAHGTVTLLPSGAFTYAPAAGFTGTDAFTYIASDGALSSPAATVTITLSDRAPSASADAFSGMQGAFLQISAPGVLGNDSDPDLDALSAVLVAAPQHGTLSLASDGSFSYQPAPGFAGQDSFTYQATDGVLSSAGAVVTLDVQPSNHPPVAAADSWTWQNGDLPLAVAAPGVLANDSDPDLDPLSAILVSGPAHGSLDLRADGSFTYLPDAGFAGQDSFVYAATDGQASSPAQVTLDVVLPALYEAGGLTLSVNAPGMPGGAVTFVARITNAGTLPLAGARLALSPAGAILGRASSGASELSWDGAAVLLPDLPVGGALDVAVAGEVTASPGDRAGVAAILRSASGRQLAAAQQVAVDVERLRLDAGGCGCHGSGGADLGWLGGLGVLLARRRRSALPRRRDLHLGQRLIQDHVGLVRLAPPERIHGHHGNPLPAIVQADVDQEFAGRAHLDGLALDVHAAAGGDAARDRHGRPVGLVAGPLHRQQDLAQRSRRLVERAGLHARSLPLAHLDLLAARGDVDGAARGGDHDGLPFGGDHEMTALAARDGASVLDLQRHRTLAALDVRLDPAADARAQHARAGRGKPDLAAVVQLDADAVHGQLGLAVAGRAQGVGRPDTVAGRGRAPGTATPLQLDDAALVDQDGGRRQSRVGLRGFGAGSGWRWDGRGRVPVAPAAVQGEGEAEQSYSPEHGHTYTSAWRARATSWGREPCGSR